MTILSSSTAATPAAPALLDVYARVGPLLVGGEGAELIAEDGTRYLDFVAGVGVNALGYNHPLIPAALERALGSGLIPLSHPYPHGARGRPPPEVGTRSFAPPPLFSYS